AEPRDATPPMRLDAISLPDIAARRMLDLLGEAKRPLILLGPAMARPQRRSLVDRLTEVTGVPALVMESPRGVNDPALHAASSSLAEADVVLLIGKSIDYSVRFGQPPAFASGARFMRIDVDAATSDRCVVTVAADPVAAVERLVAAAKARAWQRSAWPDEVAHALATRPAEWTAHARENREPIHPLRVCAALQPLVAKGAM